MMKKVTVLILSLLLVLTTAIPAMAAGAVQFSMSTSSSTVSRGDTITISVSVSSSTEATSFGLSLAYDTSVFELVNGNCAAAGALVNSFSNGFAFMFQSPTAYSGSVGSVTLKVKDSAPLGTYSVSGNASCKNGSDAVAAYGSSVSITVSCNHSYGSWTETTDGHQQTCSSCNQVNTAPHAWDKEDVIKAANCKEGGESKFTCTACGATKTEKTPVSSSHAYSAWKKVDAANHTHTCADCGKTETVAHTWDGGTVSKQPTCIATGEMVYTCTGCSDTRKETIATLTTHSYDHGCDTDCNICGATRTTSHVYSNEPHGDATGHWYECVHCHEKANVSNHLPGEEPTAETSQVCVICDYVLKAALTHTHSFAEDWASDENSHWHACSECEERDSASGHTFENDCDTDCNVCGYTRETEHIYAEAWTNDSEKHWHECTGCGLKAEEAAHIPGPDATYNAPQTCTVCGYELAPCLVPEETEPTVPTVNEPEKQEGIPGWATAIIAVASAGLSCGATLFLSKKKKS